MTAMTAATLDSLSGGRFRLGLGVSGPQVSEGWYGVKFDKPLARTREYVEIVRKAMTPRAALLRGRALDAAAARAAPASRIKLTVHPQREHIPLYIAAIGPKNLEQTGEIADGALLIFLSAEHLEETAVKHLRAGREKAGKTMEGFDVCPTLPLALGDDKDVQRPRRHVPPLHRPLRRRHGQPQAELLQPARPAHGVREGGRRRSRTSTCPATRRAPPAAVPHELIDRTTLLGSGGPHRGPDEGLRGRRRHHADLAPAGLHAGRADRRPARRHRRPGAAPDSA